MREHVGRTAGLRGLYRVGAAALILAGLTSSCSTPPSKDNGLVGILYHAAVRPDVSGVKSSPRASRARRAAAARPAAQEPRSVDGAPTVDTPVSMPLPPPPAYRISPGDVLAVSYFPRPPRDEPQYRVENHDILTVSIAGQDTYTDDVMVRPDGCISFYMIGETCVRGRTIAQVRADIAERLASIMPAAEVTVILKEANALARRFLETLRSNTDLGSTRVMQVRWDGTVTFPIIGEVNVMGRTLAEVTADVETQYDDLFRNGISVALNLNSSSEGNIAVLGEVRSPGRYTIVKPVSVFFALAMAGGTLDTANRSQVVVVKKRDQGVTWYVVNVDLESGRALGPDIPLDPQDMLLVPKSGVADLNLFVDQYIRRLLPIPISGGVGAYYDLNN